MIVPNSIRVITQSNMSLKKNSFMFIVIFLTATVGCSHQTASSIKSNFNDAEFEHIMYGEQYLHNGQYFTALQEFQIASQMNPNDWAVHNKIGMILEHQGQLEGAITEYQTVIRLDYNGMINPADKSRWHYRLAGALLKAGRSKEAKSEYMMAYRIASQDRRHDKKIYALASQSLRYAQKLP